MTNGNKNDGNKILFDAIGGIDDSLIAEAEDGCIKITEGKRRKIKLTAIVAAALAAALLLAVFVIPGSRYGAATVFAEGAIYTAEYPERTKYPSYSYHGGNSEEDQKKREELHNEYLRDEQAWASENKEPKLSGRIITDVKYFYDMTAPLTLADNGDNVCCSPLNIYIAFAMLAEVTGGDTRRQILDLYGKNSASALAGTVSDIWNAAYKDDGIGRCLLANSVWLRDDTAYVGKTLEKLSKKYYASSFAGKMGSDSYNELFRNWLNEQTNGFLSDGVSKQELKKETALALVSTVYFTAKWDRYFMRDKTEPSVFHSPHSDVTADFMHGNMTEYYYRGEDYGAVFRSFDNGGGMWFILPDEDSSVSKVIGKGEYSDMIFSERRSKKYDATGQQNDDGDWENKTLAIITQSIPKFDITSEKELCSDLEKFGVTDVLDAEKADFTPVAGNNADGIYLSKAEHDVRVKINEEGVEAASYTALEMAYGILKTPSEKVDFTLDRPFIFVITSTDGLPLFAGIVNRPTTGSGA